MFVVVERTMLLLLQLVCWLATSPVLVWDRVLHGEVLSHFKLNLGFLPSSSEHRSAAYAAARAAPCHCDGDMVGASPLARAASHASGEGALVNVTVLSADPSCRNNSRPKPPAVTRNCMGGCGHGPV